MPLSASDFMWWLPAGQVYLGVLIMGALVLPLWSRLWEHREDQGAGLWPVGGVVMYILAMQLVWRTGLLKLHFVWAVLVMVTLAGAIQVYRIRSQPASCFKLPWKQPGAVQAFMVFTFLFWFWTLVRGADPAIEHTEQAMDVMWMQSAMASHSPPIQDGWFDGQPATYYADGHQALGFLAILFGLPSPQAVHTGQILWFALTGSLAYQAGISGCKGASPRLKMTGGLLALLLICFVSTVPGAMDAVTKDRFWWWWDASRVMKDGSFPLITEFPFFSFFLGDNHAHLLGIPVLLLSLLAAMQLSSSAKITVFTLLPVTVPVIWSWRINPCQTPTCMALGTGALILRGKQLTRNDIRNVGLSLIPVLLLIYPLRAPGPELQLAWQQDHATSLQELFLIFGFMIPGLAWLLFLSRNRFHLFVIVLLVGMIAVCQRIYLVDVFQNRMNTVFKVYYQVWILGGIGAAGGWVAGLQKKGLLRTVSGASLLVCLLPGLLYAGRLSLKSMRGIPKGLHAWSTLRAADQRLLSEASVLIRPGERIVEPAGISYDAGTSVLGTWTAGNTLLGWVGHQNQWRPSQSKPDPIGLYQAGSMDEVDQQLQALEPDWVLYRTKDSEALGIHPDWIRWMDQRSDRMINQPEHILFRIR